MGGQAQLLQRDRLGAQGENAARYLSKGRPVAIDGRLEWREWEAQDGTKRQAVDIIAESVQFLGSREGGPPGNGSAGGFGSGRAATLRSTARTSSPRLSALAARQGAEGGEAGARQRRGHSLLDGKTY